jgi:DNA mismatch repair ATPase MutS
VLDTLQRKDNIIILLDLQILTLVHRHYHSLAAEFQGHPEIRPKRMQISVDDENRKVTFLYKLEDGVAEGSFGMVNRPVRHSIC